MNIKQLLALSFCVGLTLFSCQHKAKEKAPELLIDVYTASQQIVPYRYTFISQTASNLDFTIEPRVNGYLLSKNYSSGKPVNKGDLLFEIESAPFIIALSQAKANVASARASYIKSQANYNRTEPLAKIQALSQSDLDAARAELIAAQQQLNVAQQQQKNAELQLSYTKIYAPHSGIGSASNAVSGDYVGVGTNFPVLATISYIDTVSVNLSFPVSKYLEIIKASDSTNYPSYKNAHLISDISMQLSDGSTYPEKGIYNYTKTDVDDKADVIIFQVLFPNLNYALKSGQFIKVTTTIGAAQNAVIIPQKCVTQTQNIYNIWVITPDNTASYRVVTLGDTFENNYIVTSGLKAGEMVAANGFFKLRDGEKVIPKKL